MSTGGGFLTPPELPARNSSTWSELPNSPQIPDVLEGNKEIRGCYALADLEIGYATNDEAVQRLKALGKSAKDVVSDPDCIAYIEKLTARPDIIAKGARAQAARVMRAGITKAEVQLESPELSVGQLGDLLKTMTRLNTQMEKQPSETEPVRKLTFLLGITQIDTPEGHYEFRIKSLDDVVEVIRIMRCTDMNEVRAVIDIVHKWAPTFYHGDLTLRGW